MEAKEPLQVWKSKEILIGASLLLTKSSILIIVFFSIFNWIIETTQMTNKFQLRNL